MEKMRAFSSLLFLICLSALTPATYSQAGDQLFRSQPSRMYRVTGRDEKTSEQKIGFIDRTGKMVIGFGRLPKTTIAVGDFHEGLAVIYLKKNEGGDKMDYKVGYIGETGEVVIAPRFDTARDFSEGLAYVEATGFRGFIDRAGKPVIKISDDLVANDFHEGLAAVGTREWWRGRSWGYIDRSGRLVIGRQYSFADDFSEGLAGVEVGGKYGFINKQGEAVIPPRFELRKDQRHSNLIVSSRRFSEGLACVKVGGLYGYGLYGYINKKGDFIIPPQFARAQEFSEGLAWVATKDEKTNVVNKVGWIDKTGRWVVTGVNGRTFSRGLPELFSYANELEDWRYSEGLVPFIVYSSGRVLQGYMDRRGEVAIRPAEFDRVGPFVGGLARVEFASPGLVGEYGYIDKTGRFVWRSK